MVQKIAVITGGSAGVGRASLTRLVEQGYKIGVIARGQDRLDMLEITYGDAVHTVSCDVADADGMMDAAREIADHFGPPDVWLNCAMLTSFSPFNDMNPAEFDRIVAATFTGQVNGTRAALAVMKDSDKPVIVNVGSGLSYRAVPFQSAYCASKHAINGFTASLRSELLRGNRRVDLCLIQLPAMNTPQFDWARNRLDKRPQPAPPIYQPDVAATAVLKAIDTRAREIFVGKSVLQLIFGTMVLPDWLDHKLASSGADMQKSDADQAGMAQGNLFEPAPYDPRAEGSFGDDAKSRSWIVDADLARKVVFFGVPTLAFVLGLIIG